MSTPVFQSHIDVARNLVSVRFSGDLSGPALASAVTQVRTDLGQLRSGFTIFADFGGVASMDMDCVTPLTAIMDLCRTHGVGMIVRILPRSPDRDIGINLLGIVHYRGKVKTVTVDTLEEAERVLK
jgi:hypothetical protein